MKYPALDVRGADPEIVLAIVDDWAPSAVEDVQDGISIFFGTTAGRDEAARAVVQALPDARIAARDVDDEDWARRSQMNLTPITVGRITVTPPWFSDEPPVPVDAVTAVSDRTGHEPAATPHVTVTITPSMGFGTGHHATTRLCLDALQRVPLTGTVVLDVGTGSGVLAIAAALLGARDVLGIDFDPDAISSAQENLESNPAARGVRLETVDVKQAELPRADVVVANLTGAALIQVAPLLLNAVLPGGRLIVSGVQSHERPAVEAAFAEAVAWSQEEAGWVALMFNRSPAARV